jgi:hypothetical protein
MRHGAFRKAAPENFMSTVCSQGLWRQFLDGVVRRDLPHQHDGRLFNLASFANYTCDRVIPSDREVQARPIV